MEIDMNTVYRAVVYITTNKTRKIHLYLKSKYDRDRFLNEAHKNGFDAKSIGVVSAMAWDEALQKAEVSINELLNDGEDYDQEQKSI